MRSGKVWEKRTVKFQPLHSIDSGEEFHQLVLRDADLDYSSKARGHSISPLTPIGVDAAKDAWFEPKPKIFSEFALTDRVGIISGGNSGLGLEMAFCEAGARTIIVSTSLISFLINGSRQDFVKGIGNGSRMEYVSVDVRNQKDVWEICTGIGEKEKRVNMCLICVAAGGILKPHRDCLTYPAGEFEEVMDVNTNGVLYTAQGTGQQMRKFGNGGSIILIASMSGSITNKDHAWVLYNTSKFAVLQLARSIACELGPETMTAAYLDKQPELLEKWSKLNSMGRIGRPDELRCVITWLASDASSFCTWSDILVTGGHHAW